jgi:hypothetical protein
MDVRRRCAITLLAVCVGGSVLAGCGASDDPAAARARHFYAALAEDDGSGACADLAPEARLSLEQEEEKPCAEAVLDQDLPSVTGDPSVKVYGSMAQVAFGTETTFLSRFDDRWLLTAVGCAPVPESPYDCTIEVG